MNYIICDRAETGQWSRTAQPVRNTEAGTEKRPTEY